MLEGIDTVIELLKIAITTAPKTRGENSLTFKAIKDRKEIEKLANEMRRIGDDRGLKFFHRDSISILKSDCVILLGVKGRKPLNLNCGGCGFNCDKLLKNFNSELYNGPLCIFKILDLGIAIGVAAKVASEFCVDNRIMFSAGAAAKVLKLIDGDIVLALPLSVSSKNIYFDRKYS